MAKECSIIFYGEDFTPLSNECYGCYHYGYICSGSVYARECPAGIVENIAPSIIANTILNYTKNRFTLARIFGYDINEDVKKDDLSTEQLKNEYHEAVKTPDDVIQLYKQMYNMEEYAEVDLQEREEINELEKNQSDPFEDWEKNAKIVNEDEDLPF